MTAGLLHQVDAAVEDRFFLHAGHGDRVLVRVPVDADLVPCVHDHLGGVGERLEGVTGHEERGAQVVALEQRQQPWYADLAGEQPTGCLLYTSPSPRDRTRSRM